MTELYDMKINVYKDPYGDGWEPDGINDIRFDEFHRSTRNHQLEVMMCMDYIASKIQEAGAKHDVTKNLQEDAYFRDFLNWKLNGVDMDEGEWFPMHVKAERHHLRKHAPEDVNLIDVIEMICDCVCAAMARSGGNVRPIEIDNDILQKAVKNTTELIQKQCAVVGVGIVDSVRNDGGRTME